MADGPKAMALKNLEIQERLAKSAFTKQLGKNASDPRPRQERG